MNNLKKVHLGYSLDFLINIGFHKLHNPFMIRSVSIMFSTTLHNFKSVKADLDCFNRLLSRYAFIVCLNCSIPFLVVYFYKSNLS